MKNVFRIENKLGLGPYYGIYPVLWMDKDHSKRVPKAIHDDLHKYSKEIDIWLENPDNYIEDLFYGFKTVDELKLWFSEEELHKLFNLGFSIVEVSPKHVFNLENQIVFIRK